LGDYPPEPKTPAKVGGDIDLSSAIMLLIHIYVLPAFWSERKHSLVVRREKLTILKSLQKHAYRVDLVEQNVITLMPLNIKVEYREREPSTRSGAKHSSISYSKVSFSIPG
jgi:hypothetical protein